MDLATPLNHEFTGTFAVTQRLFSSLATISELEMRRFLRLWVWLLLFLGAVPSAAQAQRVHEVQLEANPAKEVYRFSPTRVTARAGDVLLFRAVSGTPHSIVFEAAKLSGSAREALNGAMGRRSGDLSSPLLAPDGAEYRMVVPALPVGTYEFFCLPHRAYDERGALRITK
jgi:plastocyanin